MRLGTQPSRLDSRGGGVAVNKVISAQDRASGPVNGAAVVGTTGLSLRLAPRSERCATARRLPDSELEAGLYSGSAPVAVMEATDPGLGHDSPLARWLYLARPGGVAIERLVGP